MYGISVPDLRMFINLNEMDAVVDNFTTKVARRGLQYLDFRGNDSNAMENRVRLDKVLLLLGLSSVRDLQTLLIEKKYLSGRKNRSGRYVEADNLFGKNTFDALRRYIEDVERGDLARETGVVDIIPKRRDGSKQEKVIPEIVPAPKKRKVYDHQSSEQVVDGGSSVLMAALNVDGGVSDRNGIKFDENPRGKDFFRVKGFDLTSLNKEGARKLVYPNYGRGKPFGRDAKKMYERILESKEQENAQGLQWYFAKITPNGLQEISKSKNPDKSFYGASVLKVPAAIRYAAWRNERYSMEDIKMVADALMVSNNQQWNKLRGYPIGQKNPNKSTGHAEVGEFFEKYGERYGITNNGQYMSPRGAALLAQDIYQKKLPGSELVLRAMFSCHTGSTRIEKYLPKDTLVASKTGSWKGWNNEMSIIMHNGEPYVLSVFSKNKSSEHIAALAGGLVNDLTNN